MIAGIDLGTSSVKVLLSDGRCVVKKAREAYTENSPRAWIEAMCRAFKSLDASEVCAVALSSQVGTYVVNESEVISWQSGAGKDELEKIKSEISAEEFIREISMPHPDIISYPMPRLLYIKKHYDVKCVHQPKDILIKFLTGDAVSDAYSWRGLANIQKGGYSSKMLDYIGVSENILPRLEGFDKKVGCVIKEAASALGLREGVRVYNGCNDYFSGLLGMGIKDTETVFDVTGTSEHVGVLTDSVIKNTSMVSGPYFFKNVHYGVTASSGASLDFGLRSFGGGGEGEIDIDGSLSRNAPIFLPYLNGERAPIWDSDARGMFFGISGKTTASDLLYSVLEGVAFSTYHIYEQLGGAHGAKRFVTAGGAAENLALCSLKADVFSMPVSITDEKDTSALGACIIAAYGEGIYKSLSEALDKMCRIKHTVLPAKRDVLKERFEIYKKLYENNKNNFKIFRRMEK